MRFNGDSAGEAISQLLAEAFAAADASVSDIPSPTGEYLSANALLEGLRALGSGGDWARRVADLTGIDRRTVQRIRAGSQKASPGTLAKLRDAWDDQRKRIEYDRKKDVKRRRAEARAKVRARLTRPGGTFKLTGRVAVSNDSRPKRPIEPGPDLTQASREHIIDAWENGDAQDVDTAFHDALDSDYVSGMTVESVEELTWE